MHRLSLPVENHVIAKARLFRVLGKFLFLGKTFNVYYAPSENYRSRAHYKKHESNHMAYKTQTIQQTNGEQTVVISAAGHKHRRAKIKRGRRPVSLRTLCESTPFLSGTWRSPSLQSLWYFQEGCSKEWQQLLEKLASRKTQCESRKLPAGS